MPAQNVRRVDEDGVYSHIYNKGVEGRIIFADEEDYQVFLGYLKDYLTAPISPESAKKEFTVNGRIFRGVPHQPKNYFNKVELVAYSLMPNHFHLLVHQITKGSSQSFIRSLCTRYSMYFNKKYQRTGALFQGPYKSVQIKDVSPLLYLSHYLHHGGDYSSYQEFLGLKETAWVKPKVVLSFFNKSENKSFKGTTGYKHFVEKYQLDSKEKELLQGVILESESEHLERRNPELAGSKPSKELHSDTVSVLEPWLKVPEFITAAVAIFILLFTLGIRNIWAFSAKTQITKTQIAAVPSPTPAVSGIEDTKPDPAPQDKIMVAIKITDGAESVNVRQEPAVKSQKIGEAKDGETFEFVSVNSGWYEVKLTDGSSGFISARYLEVVGENN